jgi:aminoglycoside phosphotransferase (APT) family kinase protein
MILTLELARKLIAEQFPEYSHLPIIDVEKQGHDNRTYRLGPDMLIRMPTTEEYAPRVFMEQSILPKLAPHLSLSIPVPIKMGNPSAYTEETSAVARKMTGELAQPILIDEHKRSRKFDDANVDVSKVDYPYPFSIYQWLPGKSINLLTLTVEEKEQLAFDLAKFLISLHEIADVDPLMPDQHSDRGEHVSVYDKGAREQIAELAYLINSNQALDLWERAWAMWKATFELCQITDKNSPEALVQKRIIEDVIYA